MADDGVRSISIETSGPVASVALGIGDQLLIERTFAASIGHAGALLPTVDELCRESGWRPADLNDCYVSIGPGSFTGLRVAVAFARHLALAVGVRVVAVPTLEVIAWNLANEAVPDLQHIAVFLEAKKGMVFAALFAYDRGVIQSLKDPEIVTPADFLQQAPRPLIVSGSGCRTWSDLIHAEGAGVADESAWTPRAAGVFALGRIRARAGEFTLPAQFVPQYVRRPEAEELWEKRRQREDSSAKPG